MSSDSVLAQDLSWQEDGLERTGLLPSERAGRLASYSMRAPGISTALFLRQARGEARVYWENGRDNCRYAGFGIAAQLTGWGPGRFRDIQQQAAALFATAHVFRDDDHLAAPRLFGGFSFRDDFVPDKAWSGFPPAQFILPHFQLVQEGEASWLTINAIVSHEDSLQEAEAGLTEALRARYAALLAAADSFAPLTTAEPALELTYPLDYATWAGQVAQAVQAINETALEKVVLSRICEVRYTQPLDLDRVLAFLNETYQQSTRFLLEPRPYHAFYGATPELLARVDGNVLTTMALAGSAPRGASLEEDRGARRSLIESSKDQQEHRLVVEAMRRRLAPLVERITMPVDPEVVTLSYIHHLHTPLKAMIKEPAGVLPLVEALHPTPALGGSPRELALSLIREIEEVPRGWYAGPVGWLDHKLNGEFAVAIRSAVAQERRAWLYAGAGIVAGSQAEHEWSETTLKFWPMLRALNIEPDRTLGT